MATTLRQPVTLLASLVRHSTQHWRCMSSVQKTFYAKDLQIERCPADQMAPKPDPEKLVFGAAFSDHMLSIEWNIDRGWAQPQIHPVRELKIHPAAKVLHYAVEIFEGMKAYRCKDNKVRLFRPDKNVARFQSSAKRSVLPAFDEGELTECIRQLVALDQEWVPYHPTSTLYLRPTMIGTEPSLGVTRSRDALLYVLTGPVGPYYPTGFKPISLLADPKFVRAPKGGVGAYKMGSNYAPTIYTQIEALEQHGCQQVLWIYGDDRQVTEVGTMNFFIYWVNEQGEKELLTPCLSSGLILPGVTRKSLLELSATFGEFKVTERDFYMGELVKALNENRVLEIFGAGTACVVCPVEEIIYDGEKLHIPTMKDNAPMTTRLYKELTDIQFGRVQHEWSVAVD